MNNPYLTKIKEIKKEIERLRKEEPCFDIYNNRIDDAEVDKFKAKLQTAVEFLQMTKEVKLNDVEYMRAYFSMATNEEAWNIYQGQVDAELENINSALKEAGEGK